jgi:hypothetical protein
VAAGGNIMSDRARPSVRSASRFAPARQEEAMKTSQPPLVVGRLIALSSLAVSV